MHNHPIRKSFGLIVLYSIIIIGIFVLQFKNESVISKTAGSLSVSFAQTQNKDETFSLKNTLLVSFKGISFSSDETQSAELLFKNENGSSYREELSLVSYEQPTPLSYTFYFTNDTSLTFAVSGTDSNAALSISVNLPANAEGLFLHYKPNTGFSVTEKTQSKVILNSKNLTYAFTAAQINNDNIFLNKKIPIANYVVYDPSEEFRFASLDSDMIIAQKSTYDVNIKTLRENLVADVANSIRTNQSLSEKSVTAYVAELASQGRFSEAVNYVPDSFKKGNKRTYLSAPYFNNLEAMYGSLEMYNENMSSMISNAVSTPSLSIFTIDGLADYIDISSDSSLMQRLLALPKRFFEEEEHIKVSQASGILRTYLRLASLHSAFADSLLPAAQKSIEIIEANCNLSDSILTLSERNVPVSNLLALSTGNAIIKWGEFNNKPEYIQGGYALINSILSLHSLDSTTLADVYPILVSNSYYPHFKVLSRSAARTIWAWTCAPSISYTAQNESTTIVLTFLKNESHYAVISGITPFSEIEIYGLSFHSDPRFETYNSSGFIYHAPKQALFLKSRHKNENEIIHLTYQ